MECYQLGKKLLFVAIYRADYSGLRPVVSLPVLRDQKNRSQ
jgi:hypothetical protein